jgi:hypothetical protein
MRARWAAAPMQLKRAVSSPSNPIPLQFRDGAASASFSPFRQQECYGTSPHGNRPGSLRRLHLLQPRERQADCRGAAGRGAEARQAPAPPARAARVSRRHESFGNTASLAVHRRGARAIALFRPACFARGRRLQVVNKEVTYWLDHNSPSTLLIGLTEGELA